jgi:hypothetical protein
MSDELARVIEAERATIVASLTDILRRLDQSGELLAAVHRSHALDCLDPDHPLNRRGARRED